MCNRNICVNQIYLFVKVDHLDTLLDTLLFPFISYRVSEYLGLLTEMYCHCNLMDVFFFTF